VYTGVCTPTLVSGIALYRKFSRGNRDPCLILIASTRRAHVARLGFLFLPDVVLQATPDVTRVRASDRSDAIAPRKRRGGLLAANPLAKPSNHS